MSTSRSHFASSAKRARSARYVQLRGASSASSTPAAPATGAPTSRTWTTSRPTSTAARSGEPLPAAPAAGPAFAAAGQLVATSSSRAASAAPWILLLAAPISRIVRAPQPKAEQLKKEARRLLPSAALVDGAAGWQVRTGSYPSSTFTPEPFLQAHPHRLEDRRAETGARTCRAAGGQQGRSLRPSSTAIRCPRGGFGCLGVTERRSAGARRHSDAAGGRAPPTGCHHFFQRRSHPDRGQRGFASSRSACRSQIADTPLEAESSPRP